MSRQKYSHEEAGRLGGLTAAHRMTAEERSERARKGGMAVLEKYGRGHMLRLRLDARQEKDDD